MAAKSYEGLGPDAKKLVQQEEAKEEERRASYTDMKFGTQADWDIIKSYAGPFSQKLADRVLDHLRLLDGDFGGFPVDRLTHCLQTAQLAEEDGRDEEYIVCALLHDIGDTLGSYNHPDIAASILKPFISEKNLFMVEKHGLFQGYYFFHYLGLDRNLRDQFRGHPYWDYVVEFCAKYDAPAFDPKRETKPLSYFEPMVRRLFATPKNSIYLRKDGSFGAMDDKPAPRANL
ncbi:hypothetical protein DFJ74DRAFT_695865 [Hyaloraphidium curvatum]|nr:hypothetical protein DFJ74DRAFT_695865 [Hyaloraphidium curvatum]